MAQEHINLGTPPGGVDGDTDRAAWTKAEANFNELYGFVGTGTGSLTEQVQQNTDDIATLQPQVATNTQDIATANGHISQNTTNIAANAAAINTLQTNPNFANGLVTVGSDALASAARIWLDAAAGQQKKVQFQTAGKARWEVGADADAESGGDVGSSLYVQNFTDAGAVKQRILTFDRSLGGTTFGNNNMGMGLNVRFNNAAGYNRNLTWQSAGSNRWNIVVDATAEAGSNAGSNLNVMNYNDAGVALGTVLSLSRANGQVTIGDGQQNGAIVYSTAPTSWSSFVFMKGPVGGATPNRWNMMCDTDANNATWKLLRSANGTTWSDCITAARGTGYVTFANGITAQQAAFISPSSETDVIIGYNGSNNNGNYFASGPAGFALCSTNGTGGYAASVLNWNRSGYWTIIGNLYPNTDNAYLMGASSNRWTQIWAVNGTIQTCDMRTKTDIVPNALGLDFVNSIEVKQYRLIEAQKKVEHVEPKEKRDEDGELIPQDSIEVVTPIPGVRTHIGPLAQDVAAAFDLAGCAKGEMAAWCLSDPTDPDSLQHLRPDELIWTLWTAVQELSAQVKALQAGASP